MVSIPSDGGQDVWSRDAPATGWQGATLGEVPAGCDNDPVKAHEQFVNTVARTFGLQVSRVGANEGRLPIEATADDAAMIRSLRPYTMTSAERLWSLLNAVTYVTGEQVAGDFVECGVWRGGSVMAMAQQLNRLSVTDRRIWLYDTFAGMTAPTEDDIAADTGETAAAMMSRTEVGDGNNVWAHATRQDVEMNLATTNYPSDNFVLVEGDVAQTLSVQSPEAIAILRLDTDWYESTKVALEVLYPRLAVGGVCILDDYGHWQGARKAVDDYFAATGKRPYMHPIDYSGRVFIKTS